MKIKNWHISLLVPLVTFALGLLVGYAKYVFDDNFKCIETKTIYKTHHIVKPIYKDSVILRYKTISIPISANISHDTLKCDTIHDSIYFELPITQNHYSDSTYEAWISGYEPCLDSIKIYNKTEYITTTFKSKPKKWSVGLQGGIGVTTKGLQPYIGVGISYNLISF